VTIVLDRAGVTGEDGPSHNGMWDLSTMNVVPGLSVAAPRDAATLRLALRESVALDGPAVVRFPKGAVGDDVPAIGVCDGMDLLRAGTDVLVVSVGAMAPVALDVAARLAEAGIEATVVDPRWVKPVNPGLVALARAHTRVVTIEDNGRVGGVGSTLALALADAGVAVPVQVFGLPQEFLPQGKRDALLVEYGLGAKDVARAVIEATAAETDGRRLRV
jgi:1-deoxy-D-xylulose-5-phosphate synthase